MAYPVAGNHSSSTMANMWLLWGYLPLAVSASQCQLVIRQECYHSVTPLVALVATEGFYFLVVIVDPVMLTAVTCIYKRVTGCVKLFKRIYLIEWYRL